MHGKYALIPQISSLYIVFATRATPKGHFFRWLKCNYKKALFPTMGGTFSSSLCVVGEKVKLCWNPERVNLYSRCPSTLMSPLRPVRTVKIIQRPGSWTLITLLLHLHRPQTSMQTVDSWLLIREEAALLPDLDGPYRKSIRTHLST